MIFGLWFLLYRPGLLFWDFVAGAGAVAAIGGVVTLDPGLFISGVAVALTGLWFQ